MYVVCNLLSRISYISDRLSRSLPPHAPADESRTFSIPSVWRRSTSQCQWAPWPAVSPLVHVPGVLQSWPLVVPPHFKRFAPVCELLVIAPCCSREHRPCKSFSNRVERPPCLPPAPFTALSASNAAVFINSRQTAFSRDVCCFQRIVRGCPHFSCHDPFQLPYGVRFAGKSVGVLSILSIRDTRKQLPSRLAYDNFQRLPMSDVIACSPAVLNLRTYDFFAHGQLELSFTA